MPIHNFISKPFLGEKKLLQFARISKGIGIIFTFISLCIFKFHSTLHGFFGASSKIKSEQMQFCFLLCTGFQEFLPSIRLTMWPPKNLSFFFLKKKSFTFLSFSTIYITFCNHSTTEIILTNVHTLNNWTVTNKCFQKSYLISLYAPVEYDFQTPFKTNKKKNLVLSFLSFYFNWSLSHSLYLLPNASPFFHQEGQLLETCEMFHLNYKSLEADLLWIQPAFANHQWIVKLLCLLSCLQACVCCHSAGVTGSCPRGLPRLLFWGISRESVVHHLEATHGLLWFSDTCVLCWNRNFMQTFVIPHEA